MKLLSVLLLCAFAVVFVIRHQKPARLPASSNVEGSVKGSTCSGRTYCGVVYMAPWCPHCRDAVFETQKLISKAEVPGTAGMRVIVGMGTPETSRDMVNRLGSAAELDMDHSAAKKYSVHAVPAYFVLDKEGSVILEGQEAHEWLMKKFAMASY